MDVKSLPDAVTSREQSTGMICPECGGALVVRAEGDGAYLHFRCRVGHGFGLDGLVELKEQRLEDVLWTAVMAFEELAGLLSDARALGRRYTAGWLEPAERIAALRAGAAAVRRVIDANRPLEISPGDGAESRG
jgi:two-component system chemotaxis response regulator CheB